MADGRPNVLFLFTDDQRFDTIAALGNPAMHTPNLDALVAEGTAFTQAHIMGGSAGAVCMPSRAMLHTGRTLYRLERQGQEIPTAHVTMGEAFARAGYATFATGKWHNGRAAFARSFASGEHIFFGGMADHWNVPAYHYDPRGRYETTLPACPDPFHSNEVLRRQADHVESGTHSTDLFAGAVIDFLERRDPAAPFFAYVSFMAPHDPRTMPRKYLELYDPENIPLPENFLGAHPFDNGNLKGRDEELEDWPRTPEAVRRHIAEYYAMISHLDDALGRIRSALRARGVEDNTILVFAGDNGLAVGQHGLMGKQNLYDHSLRVPLIFHGPGIPEGATRDAYAYLLDLFPTLCELCGVERPSSVEGQSLSETIRDGGAAARDHLHLAYRHVQRAVKDRRHKLIEYVVNGRRTTQLFDVQKDPAETCNLAAAPACREIRERLRAELREGWRNLGDDQEGQGREFWAGFDSTSS